MHYYWYYYYCTVYDDMKFHIEQNIFNRTFWLFLSHILRYVIGAGGTYTLFRSRQLDMWSLIWVIIHRYDEVNQNVSQHHQVWDKSRGLVAALHYVWHILTERDLLRSTCYYLSVWGNLADLSRPYVLLWLRVSLCSFGIIFLLLEWAEIHSPALCRLFLCINQYIAWIITWYYYSVIEQNIYNNATPEDRGWWG